MAIVVPLDCSQMSQEEAESDDFLIQMATQMAAIDGIDVVGCGTSIEWA